MARLMICRVLENFVKFVLIVNIIITTTKIFLIPSNKLRVM